MNIRSITAFVEVSYPVDRAAVRAAAGAVDRVRSALEAIGMKVQSTRLATAPFPALLATGGPERALDWAASLQAEASSCGISYVSLGPVRLGDESTYLEVIPSLLGALPIVFTSVEIASTGDGIDLARIWRMASLVRAVALLDPDGFSNLRLAALANVGPWSPFFPAAYHGGGQPRIALATESADLAIGAVQGARTLAEARAHLVESIEQVCRQLDPAVEQALVSTGYRFQGFDFSLAPFPEQFRSIGQALEELGLPAAGGHGTLLAAAFLTDAVDRARFRRTGFCGLMLPVLEDAVLARRAAEGMLGVTDLLAYSAVCGTGLDTIPLPGDISDRALAGILMDTAALAMRLDKPLTARLMPLPGLHAGDPTRFDFEFFAGSRVMPPRGAGPDGLLAGSERLHLQRRPEQP